RRAALLLGGALSAPLVAGVLAGCEARGTPDDAWRPRALTPAPGERGATLAPPPDRAELVATIAEQILPQTDTPGARAVGVHRFIDELLAESYPAGDRERFVAGLGDLGRAFQASTPDPQRALLERLDREAAPFFRTFKDLTLVGYYQSEIGATRELHHVPVPGRYDGCVPPGQVGRTWAV